MHDTGHVQKPVLPGRKQPGITPVRPNSEKYEQLDSIVERCNLVEMRVLRCSGPIGSHALAPVLDIPGDVTDEYRRAVVHAQPIKAAFHRTAPARKTLRF
jgi:hypothetical protein